MEIDGDIEWVDFDRQVEDVMDIDEHIDDDGEETLYTQLFYNQLGDQIKQAKGKELEVWKEKEVYEEIDHEGEKLMSLRWKKVRKKVQKVCQRLLKFF